VQRTSRRSRLYLHLRDLLGSYDYSALQAKILRSLTPGYDKTVFWLRLPESFRNSPRFEQDIEAVIFIILALCNKSKSAFL
jgi:hypothetical protein